MKCKIIVDIKKFKAIRLFESKDSSRFILNGVHFECHKNKVLMVSTDGRQLAVVRDQAPIELQNNGQEPICFSLSSAILNMIVLKRKSSVFQIVYDNGSISIDQGHDCQLTTKEAVGNYPKIRQVIPSKNKGEALDVCFNARLLKRFAKASELIAGAFAEMQFFGQEGDGPIQVRIGKRDDFYGLLMPIKNQGTPTKPEWI